MSEGVFIFWKGLPLGQATGTAPATTSGPATATSQAASQPAASQPAITTAAVADDAEEWITVRHWERGVTSIATLVLVVLLGYVLTRIFRNVLKRYELLRAIRWGTIAVAIYLGMITLHPKRMTDGVDVIGVIAHRVFIAVMLLVGIRLFDRLIIVPLLTRGGKVVLSRFIHQIIVAVCMVFIAAQYIHWAFDVDISSLLTGTAVISIVLGLALQETLGNFFSGLALQASVPFQPGDWIQIGDMEGRVVEMTWRAVTILTGSGNNVLIPNSIVSKDRIVNFNTPTKATASNIAVGLEYDTPPHVAKAVLLQAAGDTPGILADPAPSVALTSFDASAVTYKIFFWLDQPDQRGGIENALRMSVWYRLKQAGLNIPFNITTIEMADMEKRTASVGQRSADDRLAAIGKSELFASLSDELKKKLAAETSDFHLAAGQVFYREGDRGDSMFILLSGEAEVLIRGDDGNEKKAGDLNAGTTFGEISAMTGHPRVGTIRAKTDVRAMEIKRRDLQELFAADAGLMQKVSEVVAKRQAEREEAMKKLGASPHEDDGKHVQAHSVLERMKGLFSKLQGQ